MLMIKPIKSQEQVVKLFSENNLDVTKNSSGVSAVADGEVLGYCLYELNEKGITILTLEPQDDILLADGILRSALHVAAERSAMDARYSDTAPVELLKRLGFVVDDREKILDIDKLFGGCNCNANRK